MSIKRASICDVFSAEKKTKKNINNRVYKSQYHTNLQKGETVLLFKKKGIKGQKEIMKGLETEQKVASGLRSLVNF